MRRTEMSLRSLTVRRAASSVDSMTHRAAYYYSYFYATPTGRGWSHTR
jgi:hypothetical protein